MKCNPSVSIIIPSYNHESFIEATIESSLNQNYQGFIEIIIVDDCSTDNTHEKLENYSCLKRINRKIVILEKTKNKGVNDSIEIGLRCSSGSFIQVVASDDILSLNKITAQVSFIAQNDCDGVYSTGYAMKGDVLTKINLNTFKLAAAKGKSYEYICTQDFAAPLLQSGLFSKDVFLSAISIRNEFKSDDWAFAINAFNKYKIGYLDEYFFTYRMHENNTFLKYQTTFPMRVDVISRLVPIWLQRKAYSNIFLSQSSYLMGDKKYSLGVRFLLASIIFNPSLKQWKAIMLQLTPKVIKRILK